jgi:hypothetical protein
MSCRVVHDSETTHLHLIVFLPKYELDDKQDNGDRSIDGFFHAAI